MQLDIPPGEFEGYIFDCDGTLADSMPVHYEAWQQTLREFGAPFEFPEDLFYKLGGVSAAGVVSHLNETFGTQFDAGDISQHKEKLFLEKLHLIKPLDPVANYARIVGRTHPVSVASGGLKHIVTRTLELTGLRDLFSVIVTAEDVVNGKPAPDMFLLAASRMNVAPEKCLVFEDGEPGIQGATSAGMKTVFIPSRR